MADNQKLNHDETNSSSNQSTSGKWEQLFDLFKHLTTISGTAIGALLAFAGIFLGDRSTRMPSGVFAGYAFLFLGLSLLFSLIGMSLRALLAADLTERDGRTGWLILCLLSASFSFLAGIVWFLLFAFSHLITY